MNTNVIEALLEKFYEGNTSLQEEKILRDFFREEEIPAHLKSHQHLFAFYGDEQRQEIKDQDFEEKLTARLTLEHTGTPVIRLHQNRGRFIYMTGIAASILLLAGFFFTFRNDVFKNYLHQPGDPGPEIAYAETREVLLFVSGNLNTGLKEVEHLQMVGKAMKNMQLFNKFYQYQTMIINPDKISDQSIKSK